MNEYYIKVDFEKGRIATNLKKLVQNDYNSTKINFTFDKEGRVLFKMLYPDKTEYVTDIQNNELIFGAGILNQEGYYEYEIALYTEDGRLTDYATKEFEVRSELVDTDELVAPDDRVPVLDNLINEVNQTNNIDIDIKSENDNTLVEITRKDGSKKSAIVSGGTGTVTDVQVDGKSVLNAGVANIDLSNKVDKEEGKGLSTNDFTDGEKEKLDGLSNYDDSSLKKEIENKQEALISGQNIKTINNQSILGSGNITIEGGSGGGIVNESDPTVPTHVKNITEENINNWNNKASNPTIITSITSDTLILENNQEARLGELATLILMMPDTIDNNYESEFSFKSGETVTSLTYSSTPIIWNGDDVAGDGSFIPEANTYYEVSIKLLNNSDIDNPVISARVGVV